MGRAVRAETPFVALRAPTRYAGEPLSPANVFLQRLGAVGNGRIGQEAGATTGLQTGKTQHYRTEYALMTKPEADQVRMAAQTDVGAGQSRRGCRQRKDTRADTNERLGQKQLRKTHAPTHKRGWGRQRQRGEGQRKHTL
jgi:hypothetical protein